MDESVEVQPRLDGQLEVITHVHRRRILLELLDENPQPAEPAVFDGGVSPNDHQTLRTALHHVHLPKLEEQGFVQWDRDENQLTRGSAFEDIKPLLEVLDDHRHELPDGGGR